MDVKRITGLIAFVVIVGFASGIENYMDYGDEPAEKTAAENIHELYRLLLQRNALDNAGFAGIPLEHLMIRKSQRSPSLRLRFGRSGPRASAGVLPRPMGAAAAAAGYDDNN
ncbi:short neuropeptide F-like isoform X2 [Odontomachus brunneus]|nr:short neuropeptide F-like isoform X2 [Odontomachus brunneus]